MHGLTGGSWKRNHVSTMATEKNDPAGNRTGHHRLRDLPPITVTAPALDPPPGELMILMRALLIFPGSLRYAGAREPPTSPCSRRILYIVETEQWFRRTKKMISGSNLAGALTEAWHPVSDRTVARMLRGMGFSLQGNAKAIEGSQHEDRDAQFGHLNQCVSEHVGAAQPVVSVDTKKGVSISVQ